MLVCPGVEVCWPRTLGPLSLPFVTMNVLITAIDADLTGEK